MVMYTRSLRPPQDSFFLFGPRGTGKSTWVKQHFPQAAYFDLLNTSLYLRLQQDPSHFRKAVEALPKKSWVVVDEIQKLPQLLNEVHSLIEDHGFKFVLTGSSARKLKREGANLLAGRALTKYFFPLTYEELGKDFNLEEILRFGSLPAVFSKSDTQIKIEFLESYTLTYLREEIQQEAAVKNLSNFGRFLSIAAISNGQKLNLANLARDAGVARPTVQGYFQILIDTLVGTLLPAWPIKLRVKEVDHPKFYFFDPGAIRALTQRLRDPLDSIERGNLLETYLLHEMRAHVASRSLGGEFYYWGTHGGVEVDLIWSRGKIAVGFEVKSSSRWKSEYSHALRILLNENKISKAFGVYLGSETLSDQGVTVLPIEEFLKRMGQNHIFSASSN